MPAYLAMYEPVLNPTLSIRHKVLSSQYDTTLGRGYIFV